MKNKWIILIFAVILLLTAGTAASAQVDGGAVEADYPQLISATPTADGCTVRWSAYPGAVQYRLFYRVEGGWKGVGNTSGTSYTHRGLTNNSTFCYTVRALDAKGRFASNYDHTGLTAAYYSVPTLGKVSNLTEGQKVSWSAVEGAQGYRVYIKNGSGWKGVGNTTEPSFLNTDVQSGVTYTYTVRCIAADGVTVQSYYDRNGTSARYVATPALNSVAAVDGGLKVSWSAVQGAAMYRVYYRVEGGWKGVANTTASSYTHRGLSNNSTFCYTVRALNASGACVSGYDAAGITGTYHSTPILGKVTGAYGGQKVSWSPVEGAQNYRVYIKNGSGWKGVGNTTGTSFLNTDVQTGTAYTYTVRCIAADGVTVQSYYDKKGVSGDYYAAPHVARITPEDGGLRVSWEAVEGAAQYRLYYLTENGWKGLGTTAALSLSHQGLEDGATYTYTLRTADAKGSLLSSYDPIGCSAQYHAPHDLSVSYDGAYTLSWDAVGADAVRLIRTAFGSDAQTIALIDDPGQTSYTDAAAEADVIYSYGMILLDENGEALTAASGDALWYLGGEPAHGELTADGDMMRFLDGHAAKGYVTLGGRQYYFDDRGVMQKGGIVGCDADGYTVADETGVCCISEEIRLAAAFMMRYCTGLTLDERMKTGYLYMPKNFPYNRTYDHPSRADQLPALAIDMFTNERGNCYRYAACFACVARAAGYRARVVIGTTDYSPHGWVEVWMGGRWLVCDPDAQLPGYQMPDYYPYMMTEHYWQTTPKVYCEVTINADGVAVWQ